jgi:Protein of unknown function (DUF3431)
MKIIVARYNEDISWINQIKSLKDIIIYNKGRPLNIENEIMMENVGREGHTFYKYIYDHYDELDDYTIFIQAYPFDHLPNIILILNQLIDNEDKLNITFQPLSTKLLSCNLVECKYHKGLPLYKTYHYLFGKPKHNIKYLFGPGGQFIVHKLEILRHPKEFYLKIINLLSTSINPIEGYVIERFHSIIFNHFILNTPLQQLKLEDTYYKPFRLLFVGKNKNIKNL